MYDSGISASNLIQNVSEEADIVIPVSSDSWYRWINATEQFIYTEIFKLYASKEIWADDLQDMRTIRLKDDISVADGVATPDFDDIIKIYADNTELAKSGVISSVVFHDKPLYYTDYAGNIKLSIPFEFQKITVIYKIKPVLKSAETSYNINLPPEFVDMLASRLRGEAYMLANEDTQGAKWLMDYNTRLETLSAWAAARSVRYGE